MAQDSDEDEIWNYRSKATPKNNFKGLKTKMPGGEDDCGSHVEQQSNFIVIDSDDEDIFYNKRKTQQQQTEHWKFFMTKDKHKNGIRTGRQKSKALKGKNKSSVGNRSNKTKQNPGGSLLKTEGTNSSKKQNDSQPTEISSSPNSLKNYYTPSKLTKGKRQTPEPDDLLSKEIDFIDQATEHKIPDKKRLSIHGSDSHRSFLLESKCGLERKHLSSSSSSVSDDLPYTESQKKNTETNVQNDIDDPQAVDVIVLEGNPDQCDDGEKEFTVEDEEEQEPGGFLLDSEGDLFGADCEDESTKTSDDYVICQGSSVGGQSLRSLTPLAEADDDNKVKKSSSLNMMVHGNATDLNDSADLKASVLDSNAAMSPSKATKQTSLHTFFKARPSNVNSKDASEFDDDKLKSIYNVSSRPNLRSISSTPASSSFANETRHALNKSSSFGSWTNTQPKDEKSIQRFTNKRQCPFYKKIPGTSITVDAFRYGVIPGCEAYFLTHFHYDHYGGLTKKFSQPLYCSQVTGNLVESRLGVNRKWINPLPLWKPCVVANATLTLMEANHCPGAVIVLFETKDGKKILHTGDFRACPEMEDYAMLKRVAIDELYLDTTYCNPSYAFPSQKEVIDFVVNLVAEYISAHPKTLVVCGAYTIGKEKIFSAIAKILDSKICVMTDKKKVLDCLDDKELKSRITLNWSEGRVHVLPMGKLNLKALCEHHQRHAHFTSILAFEPTGWTHSSKSLGLNNLRPKWSSNGITLYGVPYSEHSSYLELKRFVQFVQPKRILPTVNNGSPASRQKMEAIFKSWENEKWNISSNRPSSSSNQPKMDLWVA